MGVARPPGCSAWKLWLVDVVAAVSRWFVVAPEVELKVAHGGVAWEQRRKRRAAASWGRRGERRLGFLYALWPRVLGVLGAAVGDPRRPCPQRDTRRESRARTPRREGRCAGAACHRGSGGGVWEGRGVPPRVGEGRWLPGQPRPRPWRLGPCVEGDEWAEAEETCGPVGKWEGADWARA